jgi:hypothetical protein
MEHHMPRTLAVLTLYLLLLLLALGSCERDVAAVLASTEDKAG